MEDGNSHFLLEAIESEGKAFEYSHLCHLINDSLPPYIESELISVTKQNEKNLSVALSQDSRKIQFWIYEPDSYSRDDIAA